MCLNRYQNGGVLVVTGAREGGHSPGSAHETGQACDLSDKRNPGISQDPNLPACFNLYAFQPEVMAKSKLNRLTFIFRQDLEKVEQMDSKRHPSKVMLFALILTAIIWIISEAADLNKSNNDPISNSVPLRAKEDAESNSDKESIEGISADSLDSKIAQIIPGTRVLQARDLTIDAADLFASEKSKDGPGKVCGNFLEDTEKSCMVMIVRPTGSNIKLEKLILIKNIQKFDGTFETVEDYVSETRETNNGYIVSKAKGTFKNSDGESIKMSRNGVLRVFEGQSAVVIFYNDRSLHKEWISD
jgi:hypothetical protein